MRATRSPESLRQYALLADGERGALVGPGGDIAFLCAPQWHDDAVFSSLLGGGGAYTVTPLGERFTWGGHYEQDSLIWRSRWVTTSRVTECREALAFPGDHERVVLLRRVEATEGDAHVSVSLELRAGFGARSMTVRRSAAGVWEGRSGDLLYRWSGAPPHAALRGTELRFDLTVPAGASHDLVLEISRSPLPADPPAAAEAWRRTEAAWQDATPRLGVSLAPGESRHSHAVLRGLTSSSGGMVAAATMSLPERAERGRNYDYRYAWIRDQCYAGQAAAAVGAPFLLDSAVQFVSDRLLDAGAGLRPAYTVDGGPVPDQRGLPLPGYPGAPVQLGNHVNSQFQLDTFGEALLLFAAADTAGRLDGRGWQAVDTAVAAIQERGDAPDAGIWELEPRHWAHSRLICAAGLRAVAHRRPNHAGADWEKLADALVDSVDRDCLHPTGRWQRSPDDRGVDAALLTPAVRGAVPPEDPRNLRTVAAVIDELTDDGYVYRFRHDAGPLHAAEGAFLLSGFHMALATHRLGRHTEAVRWFERSRGALGPPGLFTEEFDVVQRQLRGNLPQAFVHALLLESAHVLSDGADPPGGFNARSR